MSVNGDLSYVLTDRVTVSAGAEWREEAYETEAGQPESWTVGPYGRGQGFSAGSNGFFGYGPMAVGRWARGNVSAYADVEASDPGDVWRVGGAVRAERFDDFGDTVNGKAAGRWRFVRGSVSTGFRAPTPGQQNGFNISTRFDPGLDALVNNGTIPSISAVAMLRGGVPLRPETSVNYTLGMVADGGQWTLSADYFRIDVSDPDRHHVELHAPRGRDRGPARGGDHGGRAT